jgi:hypothetical protein
MFLKAIASFPVGLDCEWSNCAEGIESESGGNLTEILRYWLISGIFRLVAGGLEARTPAHIEARA